MNRIRVAIDVLTSGARKSLQDFKKQIAEAEGATGKLRAGWAGLGNLVKQNALAITGAAAAVTGAAFKMAQGAAETEAAFASLNQIAGKTIAQDVAGWAEDAVEKLGLSDRALFRYSATLGNIGASIGQTEAEMRSFIETNLKMAADFAAFADTSPDQVMQDLQAAYAGSSETLQKYGVFANETNLKNLLLAATGQKITGTLTSQQRVLGITLALKQKHLDIDGQWDRESGELAGQQARLQATLTNISDTIGRSLLPAFVDLFETINENSGSIEAFAEGLAGAAEDAGDFVGWLREVKKAAEDVPGLPQAAQTWWDWFSPKAWTEHPRNAAAFLERDMRALGRRIAGIFRDSASDSTKEMERSLDQLAKTAERSRPGPIARDWVAWSRVMRDAGRENENWTESARFAQRALSDQTNAHRRASDAAKDQADALEDLASIQRSLIGGELGVRDAQRQATEALREYEEAAANGVRSAEKLLRLQQSVVDAERGAQAADDAVVRAKRAEDEADRRLQEARRRDADDDEIARLEEDARKARDKVYAAEDQARNADRAIDEARRRAAEEERKASPEELAALRDRATEAQLRAADAAARYEADLKRANGETVTAVDETRLMRDALGELATALAPSSPLRQNLQGYIGELDTIATKQQEAADAAAQARLDFFGAQRDEMANRFGGFARGRASGGTVSGGSTVINNITNISPPSGPQFVKADLRDYERRNGVRRDR